MTVKIKGLLTGVLLFLCAMAAGAQTTQITASHISYFGGATITGTFCLTPTDQLGNPINIVTSMGQQVSPQTPLCFKVTSGVLSGLAIVPDVSQTQPANACYKLVINNSFGSAIATFPCIQPEGTTWSFDAYVPSSLPSIPALTLPQFQLNGTPNPVQGYLDLVCPSCTISGGHVTLPTGGGGTSNENLTFSATPTFSLATTSSRIALSGNITTFTLAAGSDGQRKCLLFVHDGTSTAYTVTEPSNVVGLMTPMGSTASKRNLQCFTYFSTDALWMANSAGVVNQ